MRARKCLKCGWVHFGVTTAHALENVREFNTWFEKQSPETQSHYHGPASLESYVVCFRCHESYQNFRDATDDEVPMGSTLQPILMEADDVK